MDSSPFLSRLNSNYSAEGDDIPRLESIIIDAATELESIRLEMERTRKVYMDLADEHESLLSYIEAHRAMLSPVRRLPVEVLQEIFQRCLPEKVEETVVDARHAPVLLTHICGGWRRVAIATPSLWSSIHIVLPRPKLEAWHQTQARTQTRINRTLRGVTEWLPRAASLSLNISILDPDPRFSVTDSISDKIIKAVLSYSSKWGSLSLRVPARFLDKYFLGLSASGVPLLHSLTIQESYTSLPGGTANDPAPGIPWKDATVMRAPKLTSISIWYGLADLIREKFPQLPLRWSLLTNIDLHVYDPGNAWPDISSLTLLSTLSLCTSLVSCSLQCRAQRVWGAQDNTQAYAGPKVLLPCLTYLCIEGIAEDFGPLVEELETPALQDLALLVQPSRDTNTRYRVAITSFLEKHGSQLQALTMAPGTMLPQAFRQLLSNVSLKLRSLHLLGRGWTPSHDQGVATLHPPGTRRDGFTIDDSLFNLLRTGNDWDEDNNMTIILSKLEIFHCNLLGEGHVGDWDLVNFVMARRPTPLHGSRVLVGCVPLQKMTIELNRPRDINSATLHEWLEPYISTGCRIVITYLDEEGQS